MVPRPLNMVTQSMSSDNIIQFPGEGGKSTDGGGSGPEDPILEKRVDAIEVDLKNVKEILQRLEVGFARIESTLAQLPKATDYASLKADVAEIKGKVSNSPTTWTLLGIVFSTWAIGSGIVFAIARMAK